MEFTSRNTNTLAPEIYGAFQTHGIDVNTRNGVAKRLPGVTTIVLTHPWERVNFGINRDANPFFHLIESIAMLAGDVGNNVSLLSYFAKNMLLFSDDGARYNAFYGTRSRSYVGMDYAPIDQLGVVWRMLKNDPESRQALVQLWDPSLDLGTRTKDKACNLCMIFSVEDGKVVMTTFNRSNDAIWGGVTGANVVHLSFFQEYVACALNLPIGEWRHVSANLHVYYGNKKWPSVANDVWEFGDKVEPMFAMEEYRWVPLFNGDPQGFDSGCKLLLRDVKNNMNTGPNLFVWHDYDNLFLTSVVKPMAECFMLYKLGMVSEAAKVSSAVASVDWRLAAQQWLKRHNKSGSTLNFD